MLVEGRDRNEYRTGDVVYYFDHDIPIKNASQFLNEIERRAKPGEITILQQIKGKHVKFEDKWIDIYTISVGFNLKYLKVNDTEYFNFYQDISACILEILPMDDNTCKVVIAVPWNRAGSFQNYVIYMKKGDVIATRTTSQVAAGLVGDFQYNLLPFLGIAK